MRSSMLWVVTLLALAAPAIVVAGPIMISFEGLSDSTILTNQYPGVAFSNAIILTAGIGLNEFEFPPRSAINVASDNGGPMTISFSSGIQSFDGYFTYAEPLTLKAFDAGNNLLASATSLFSNNESLSGISGSSPNELLQLSSAGAISFVTISGDPAGGSFALDDAVVTSLPTGVPEPGGASFALLGIGVFILLPTFRKRRLLQRPASVLPVFARRQYVTLRRALVTVVLLACGMMLMVVSSSVAWAAQSVVSPTALPPGVPVNTPTLVTFKAMVGPDPNLISNSVNVVRVTASGSAVVGALYDDGTHGDALAGDSIYTGQLSLNEPSVGTVQLMVTAAFRGSLRRVSSIPFSVGVFAPISATDAQLPVIVTQQATQLFNTTKAQSGDIVARNAVLNFLQQEPGVSSAGLSSDNSTIWIKYSSGIRGVFTTYPPGFHRAAKARTRVTPSRLCNVAPQLAINAATPPSAFIFDPFPGEFPEGSDVNGLLSSSCTGNPVYRPSSQASVAELTTMSNYSLIVLITHGVVTIGPQGQEEPELLTGEPYNQATVALHQALFSMGWLQYGGDPNTGLNYITVLPEFVSYYALQNRPQGFPQSIVYTDGCETVGTDSHGFNFALMDAFLHNGAATFLGYKNSPTVAFAQQVTDALFGFLTQSSPLTIGQAYNSVPLQDPTVDAADGSHALLVFGGQTSGQICPLAAVRLNPFGNQNGAGPYTIEVVDPNLVLEPAPKDITETVRRDVISQCSGLLFSSDRTVVVSQGQSSASYNFNAGHDPACNTLPITTRYTVTKAVLGTNTVLDLSGIPPLQLILSVTR